MEERPDGQLHACTRTGPQKRKQETARSRNHRGGLGVDDEGRRARGVAAPRRRHVTRVFKAICMLSVLLRGWRVGEAANPGPEHAADGIAASDAASDPDRGLAIVSGNGTGWGTLQAWLSGCTYDIMCLQEHKIKHPEDVKAASDSAYQKGWKSFWSPAIPSRHEAGAASAGTVVMVRKSLGAYTPPGGEVVVPGHCSAALVEAGGLGGFVVYSVYLECGDELGAHNWNTLTRIAQHARCHGRPWAACGDWNVTPTALAASGWPEQAGAAVLVPPVSHTTSTRGRAGRLIDYFVISKPLARVGLSAHVDGTAPIRTHSAVGFVAPVKPRSITTTVMKAPRKLPIVKPIGPRKEPHDASVPLELARTAGRLANDGHHVEATAVRDEAISNWFEYMENELTREYHLDEQEGGCAPYRGRAAGPRFVREPLLGPVRHGKHAAAGAKSRRLHLVQDRANEHVIVLGKRAGPNLDKEILERARAAVSAGHHVVLAATHGSSSRELAARLKAAARDIERAYRSGQPSASAVPLLGVKAPCR